MAIKHSVCYSTVDKDSPNSIHFGVFSQFTSMTDGELPYHNTGIALKVTQGLDADRESAFSGFK